MCRKKIINGWGSFEWFTDGVEDGQDRLGIMKPSPKDSSLKIYFQIDKYSESWLRTHQHNLSTLRFGVNPSDFSLCPLTPVHTRDVGSTTPESLPGVLFLWGLGLSMLIRQSKVERSWWHNWTYRFVLPFSLSRSPFPVSTEDCSLSQVYRDPPISGRYEWMGPTLLVFGLRPFRPETSGKFWVYEWTRSSVVNLLSPS